MNGIMFSLCCVALLSAMRQDGFQKDTIKTSAGDLQIVFLGHSTLMMQYQGKTIHVDPWSRMANYQELPKADLILVTHQHQDHLDTQVLDMIRTEKTIILLNQKSAEEVKGGTVMRNGDVRTALGLKIEAVPAYNLVHKRPEGTPFHPKGEGNGYVITFGGTRVYIAGDTENTPEMKALKNIDVAFLPMNLPYTMTPEMVADAARAFKPKILYPYHQGETDISKLLGLLKGDKDTEVRFRKMK